VKHIGRLVIGALIFLVFFILLIFLSGAGCLGISSPETNATQQGKIPGTGGIHSETSTAIPTINAQWQVGPEELPHEERFAAAIGSFDETYIGSMDCSNKSETFETNYTYFSGAERGTISYQLVPVKYVRDTTEVPFPDDILNATIEPASFTAEPYHRYTSHVRITVGPNVTGFISPSRFWNPTFPFYLKVQRDAGNVSEANDWVQAAKLCAFIPGLGSLMRSSPGFDLNTQENLSLRVGEKVSLPLTVRDFGGGLREEYFEIPGMLKGDDYSFPIKSEELAPFPPGMTVSVEPLQILGRSFRTYDMNLVIETTRDVQQGTYNFPLVLCYRNLASPVSASGKYPFENTRYCDTSTSFEVNVIP